MLEIAKKAIAVSCILGVLVGPIRSLQASDARLDRETLKGIKSVYVVVAVPADFGLDGAQIEADAARQFRSAGIQVKDLGPGTLLLPCVFISANILKREDDSWIYEASVSLNQAVTIAANGRSYMAPTWSVSALAFAAGSGAPKLIRRDVKNLVDRFIRAYSAANLR